MTEPELQLEPEPAGHTPSANRDCGVVPDDSSRRKSMQPAVTLRADAFALPIRTTSVQCVVTSPPYWGLRTYGDDARELGRSSLDDFIKEIVTFADEVRRVLRDDGLFWLNLGDTAAGSGGAGGDYNKGGSKQGRSKWRQGATDLAPMQWCSLPHRIVHELQDRGWLLRADICWDKGQIRPEDAKHVRRPRIAKEPIFMLAKTRDHVYYHENEVEQGNVWHMKPSRGKNHAAPFPDELARRCILISSKAGDVVLDPFNGSGTTTRVATELGRRGVGTDLYPQ